MNSSARSPTARKGRGAVSNPEGRFASWSSEGVDDGWARCEELGEELRTELLVDRARTIITRNRT